MKRAILGFIMLLFAVYAFPQGNADLIETFRMNKAAEMIDLNEEQMGVFIVYEKEIKKINNEYDKSKQSIVDKMEKLLKNKNFKGGDEIINEIEVLEKVRLDETLKARRKFASKLNNEQKIRYMIFEMTFKEKLKDKIQDKLKKVNSKEAK